VSSHPARVRQGKGMIAAGVAALAAGLLIQTLAVQSVGGEAPPQLGIASGFGDAAATSFTAELMTLAGLVLAIVGIVRYAQGDGHTEPAAPAPRATAPAFCSSCGAAITGKGRFCSSCGTRTS